MILYAVIMFVAAALIGGIALSIYRGNTTLIHDYHQEKVTDQTAYGKAFGKAMFVISASLLLSGILSLFGDSEPVAMIALATLFIGLTIGIIGIIVVQKKYNGGIF